MTLLLLINLLCTLALTGMIWLLQLLVYPSFSLVSADAWQGFHKDHTRKFTRVVGPVMVVELVTAVAIIFGGGLPFFPLWLRWIGGVLVLGLWVSTAFFQAPAHDRLAGGFQEAAHQRLLDTNRYRVALWSLRTLLLLAVVWLGTMG